jgi:hypothetical protein
MTMNPVPPASLPALFERAFVPLACPENCRRASPPAPDELNSNQTLRTPTDSTCKFAPPYSGVLRKPQPTPQSIQIPKT